MKVLLSITLSADELEKSAVAQARAAAAAVVGDPNKLATMPVETDVKGGAPATFTFDLSPASTAANASASDAPANVGGADAAAGGSPPPTAPG